MSVSGFFFNDTATTEIYTLSLHDALPICARLGLPRRHDPPVVSRRHPAHDPQTQQRGRIRRCGDERGVVIAPRTFARLRSEEHTSELQSRQYLVCRLLLEKKKKNKQYT